MDPDQPRPAAASPDTEYSLSIEDAAALYQRDGLPRTLRTIQRYCANGHLDCRRIEIPYGEKYLVTPASVAKHIAYIKETRQAVAGRGESMPVAASHDQQTPNETASELAMSDHGEPRPAATAVIPPTPKGYEERPAATNDDRPRHANADDTGVSRYVTRLEGENDFLRKQITVKDDQIKDLTLRARETNYLISGLQRMLTPLLGRPRAASDDARSYLFDERDTAHGGEGDN